MGGKKALDGQRMRRSEREEGGGRYMGNFTNHSFSISSQQVGCRKVKVQQYVWRRLMFTSVNWRKKTRENTIKKNQNWTQILNFSLLLTNLNVWRHFQDTVHQTFTSVLSLAAVKRNLQNWADGSCERWLSQKMSLVTGAPLCGLKSWRHFDFSPSARLQSICQNLRVPSSLAVARTAPSGERETSCMTYMERRREEWGERVRKGRTREEANLLMGILDSSYSIPDRVPQNFQAIWIILEEFLNVKNFNLHVEDVTAYIKIKEKKKQKNTAPQKSL